MSNDNNCLIENSEYTPRFSWNIYNLLLAFEEVIITEVLGDHRDSNECTYEWSPW